MYAGRQAGAAGATRTGIQGGSKQQELERKRQRLAFFEERHREVSLAIATAEAELAELRGSGLSSLFSRLKGNCEARVNAAVATLSQKDMERAAVDRELAALRAEIEALEQLLNPAPKQPETSAQLGSGATASAGDASAEVLRPAAPAVNPPAASSCDGLGRAVERAIDACNEARRDVLSEVETAASLGRCRMGQRNKLVAKLMSATRDQTRGECAGRAQSSIARFLRKYDEVRTAEGGEVDAAEQDVMMTLAGYAAQFDGEWLKPGYDGNTFAMKIVECLESAAMWLERRTIAK